MLPNFSSSSTKVEPSWCHGLPTFSAYFCEYSVKEDETVCLLLPTSYPPQQEKMFSCQPLSLLCYQKWCYRQFWGWKYGLRWFYVGWLLSRQVTDRMVSWSPELCFAFQLLMWLHASSSGCFEFAQKVELGAALQTGMAALHRYLKREWKPIIHNKLNF